jgi:hypothetical protein
MLTERTKWTFYETIKSKTWDPFNTDVENGMDIRRYGQMGIFSCYYYYWYYGQVCPWLDRRMS